MDGKAMVMCMGRRICAPTARHMPAQGNALGMRPHGIKP